jgi:DNA mismatch repair protein MutL
LLEGAARESPELKVPAIPVQVNAFPDNLHPFRSSPPVDLPREKDEGAHTHEAGRDKSKAGPDSSGELLFSRLPVLGQLANTYILLEARDGLLLIDQHAAHERIVYDRLSSASVREPAQRLARSVVLDFMPREAAVLRRWIAPLLEIGFEIEPFGGESFVVHAVPAVLGGHSPDILIRELLQATHEEDDIPRLDILANLAKTVACHSAIRAGQKLKPEEVRYLLESLDRTKIPDTCPHGRPLWFKLTHGDIARFFQRT